MSMVVSWILNMHKRQMPAAQNCWHQLVETLTRSSSQSRLTMYSMARRTVSTHSAINRIRKGSMRVPSLKVSVAHKLRGPEPVWCAVDTYLVPEERTF